MLFKVRFYPGIVDGSITRTFRRWKRLQVVPGNRYRQPFGEVEVVSAEEVDERSITERDAELAGYGSRDKLLAERFAPLAPPSWRLTSPLRWMRSPSKRRK